MTKTSAAKRIIYFASTEFGILEAEASKVTEKQAVIIKGCMATGYGTTIARRLRPGMAPEHMVAGFFDTREEAENALRIRLVEDCSKAEESMHEAIAARNRAAERIRKMTVHARPFRLAPIASVVYEAGPGPIDGVNDAPADPEETRLDDENA